MDARGRTYGDLGWQDLGMYLKGEPNPEECGGC